MTVRSAVQFLFDGGADTVIHLITGTGFLIFATSVFDFGLPRWVNVIGAAAAGAFGAIFVLQGVADVTHLEGLRYLAFDILAMRWSDCCLMSSTCGSSRCCCFPVGASRESWAGPSC